MKSRLVSALLVLCMLLTMIPAVFAEPEETKTPVSVAAAQPASPTVEQEEDEAIPDWTDEYIAELEARQQEERIAEQQRIEEEVLAREEAERAAIRADLEAHEAGKEASRQKDTKIWSSTDQSTYRVKYNETATLTVNHVYDNYGAETTNVTYQWYDADTGNTVNSKTASYTTAKITRRRNYYCQITDKDGYTARCYFYVYVDNNLSVRPADDNWNVFVAYNTKATLKLEVTADVTDGMTYQWYKYDENYNRTDIASATKATYTTPAVKTKVRYGCVVTDKFGNSSDVTLTVGVDNQFSAVAAATGYSSETKRVPLGEKTTLKLKVTAADKTGMTYTWSRRDDTWTWNQLDTTATTSLTTGAIKEIRYYRCVVEDRFGNSQDIYFYIYVDNQLSAVSAGNDSGMETRGVEPGTKAVLKIKVTALDKTGLTYTWSRRDDSNNWNQLDTTATTSLTTGAVKEPRYYRCWVSDKYGNSDYVEFAIYVENHLQVLSTKTNLNYDYREVAAEATPTLKIKISGDDLTDLTWQWYRSYNKNDGTYVESKVTGTKTSCTTAAIKRPNHYWCVITDKYGNQSTANFYLSVQNHFTAVSSKNGETYEERFVTPGNTTTLKVKVTADETSGLSYEWHRSYTKADGNYVNEVLPDVTGASVTTPAIKKAYNYYCLVRDKYRNEIEVRFSVNPQNHFEVVPVGNMQKFVTYNKNVTLKVKATADDTSGMTIQWYGKNESGSFQAIDGANSASYTAPAVKKPGSYYCRVTDKYKMTKTVWFYTYVGNYLQAAAKDYRSSMLVSYGETATLTVCAGANNPAGITYQWYAYDSDWNEKLLAGETKTSFTTPAVKTYTRYFCEVTDRYQNVTTVYFYVGVQNNLTVTGPTSASKVIFLEDGASKTLKVSASADKTDGLTYQWHGTNQDSATGVIDTISGADNASLTTPAIHRDSYYYCVVTDKYQNSTSVGYHLYLGTFADRKAEMIETEQTGSGIRLSWSDVPGASKYQIQRKVGSATTWTTVATVEGGRSYLDTNVKAGTKYKYAVRGIRGSTYSKRVISDQLTRKKMVTDIGFTRQNTQIKVNWKALSGAATYNVMRRSYNRTTHVATDWKAIKTGLTGTSFTDTTVVSGVDYYYSVQGVTSGGSKYTYDKSTHGIYFVESPKLSTATATSSGVKLTWATRKGTGCYAILRKASGETTWTRVGITNQLSYTDTTAKAGKEYTYTIRSMDVQGKTYVSKHITTGLSVTAK